MHSNPKTEPDQGVQAEIRPIWGGIARTTPHSSPNDRPRFPSRPPTQARQGSQHQPIADSPSADRALPSSLSTRSIAILGLGVAAGCFVTMAFFGLTQSVTSSSAPDSPSIVQSLATADASQPRVSPSIEEGKQVAIATLVSGSHQIDDGKVTFYAEPHRSGNALQQFAEVFGAAISKGENPRPIRAPLRQPKGGM